MKAFVVVVVKIADQTAVQFGHCFVIFQVNVFMFHTAPETFDKYVVQGSAPAVHADADASC